MLQLAVMLLHLLLQNAFICFLVCSTEFVYCIVHHAPGSLSGHHEFSSIILEILTFKKDIHGPETQRMIWNIKNNLVPNAEIYFFKGKKPIWTYISRMMVDTVLDQEARK